MAELVVTLTGDEANLARSLQKIITEQAKMQAGFDKSGSSAKNASDEHVKAHQKNQAEIAKVNKLHEATVQALDREVVALTRGKAAAAELRAIQSGMTREQAAGIRLRHEDIAAINATRDAARTSADEQATHNSSMTSGLAGLAASYLSLNTVASAYTQNLRDQKDLAKEALDIAEKIAKAQSTTSKNLTGLSSKEKARAISESGALSKEIGIDRAEVEKAVGAGFSAVGNIDATKNAVRAAAQITSLSPEQLSTVTTGALDVRKATGIDNAEQNLSFLLQSGKQARIEDPARLSATLAKALASGVNTVQGQDKQEASRELAATFSEFTQATTDKTGDSTATAVITLSAKLNEFFRDLPKSIGKLDEQIAPLVEKQKVTEIEKAQLALAEFDVIEKKKDADAAGTGTDARSIRDRLEYDQSVARRDKMKVDVGLSADEEKKLQGLQSQRDGLANVTDTGTFFGRRDALQNNVGAQEAFLANPVGEVAYQGAIRDFVQGGAGSKRIDTNKGELGFDASVFKTTAAEDETLSPELRVARAKSRADAISEASKVEGDKPTIGLIDEIKKDTLRQNRGGLIMGSAQSAVEGISNTFRPVGDNTADAANIAVGELVNRRMELNRYEGGTEAGGNKIGKIDEAIQMILQIAVDQQMGITTAGVQGRNEQKAIAAANTVDVATKPPGAEGAIAKPAAAASADAANTVDVSGQEKQLAALMKEKDNLVKMQKHVDGVKGSWQGYLVGAQEDAAKWQKDIDVRKEKNDAQIAEIQSPPNAANTVDVATKPPGAEGAIAKPAAAASPDTANTVDVATKPPNAEGAIAKPASAAPSDAVNTVDVATKLPGAEGAVPKPASAAPSDAANTVDVATKLPGAEGAVPKPASAAPSDAVNTVDVAQVIPQSVRPDPRPPQNQDLSSTQFQPPNVTSESPEAAAARNEQLQLQRENNELMKKNNELLKNREAGNTPPVSANAIRAQTAMPPVVGAN